MNWLILIALALAAAGGLYVRLRWRRAPQAYRAMIALAACFFVAGTLTGAWIVHLATENLAPLPPASSAPASTNTAISRGFDPARLGEELTMRAEITTIELLSCHYQAQCRVKNCKARATVVARASDAIGRPSDQYELCAPHAEQIAERERAKGREILKR